MIMEGLDNVHCTCSNVVINTMKFYICDTPSHCVTAVSFFIYIHIKNENGKIKKNWKMYILEIKSTHEIYTYQSSQIQQNTGTHQHILHILQGLLLYNDLCKIYRILNTAMYCQMYHYNSQLYIDHKNHLYIQNHIYTNQILFQYLLP